ncbi:Hypothetical protein FKW44_020641, partial [Caligus rogercresseyi]
TSVLNSPMGSRSPDAPSIRRLSIANEALKETKEALMTPSKRAEVPRLSPTPLDYGTPLEDLLEEPGVNQTIEKTLIQETPVHKRACTSAFGCVNTSFKKLLSEVSGDSFKQGFFRQNSDIFYSEA